LKALEPVGGTEAEAQTRWIRSAKGAAARRSIDGDAPSMSDSMVNAVREGVSRLSWAGLSVLRSISTESDLLPFERDRMNQND
jgi:hypothetical protein